MEGKLKSVIRSPRFGLLLKAAAFFLLFRWAAEGGALRAIVFVVAAIFLYARPTLNALVYIPSFVILLTLALFFPVSVSAFSGEIAGLAFAGLFYILLRLKDLLFIRRLWWHEALVAGLLYLATLAYFIADKSEYFLLKHAGLGAVFFVLAYELFAAHIAPTRWARQRVAALSGALLFLELAWALALMPLGYAAAAGIAAMLGFLFLHLAVIAATGQLKAATVVKHVGLVALMSAVIVLISIW